MLNIAISGSNGFVGKELSQRLLLNEQINLFKVGRSNPDNYKQFIHLETESTDEICTKLSSFDCFIHLAARAHTKNATAEDFQRDNIDLSKKLAAIAARANIKQFIYLSSIKVLGNTSRPGAPFKITDTPSPADLYGESKLASELAIAEAFHRTQTSLTIIRPPLVWGEACKGNLGLLAKMIEKKIPIPFGAIKNKRDIISLENLCDVISLAIAVDSRENRTLLVSDGKARSTKEIIQLLERFTTEKAILVNVPASVFAALKLVPFFSAKIERFLDNLEIDISETKKILNWTPKT